MKYLSTRGQTPPFSFTDAVAAGLAPDGGLFLPASLPDLSGHAEAWEDLDYPALVAAFFAKFAPEISPEEWRILANEAYQKFTHPEVAPLVRLDRGLWVLELFHGPTLAFKDFALQLLGLLFQRQVEQTGKRLVVLGATSGDTGSAAIHGCLGQKGIAMFILYPDGRVAPLQERQMAATGADNVFAIPIAGNFDDAQRLVKQVFTDREFADEVNLSAVNSINIARVLAQCVYYVWAWLRLPVAAGSQVEFVVPTGNFGNVLAGWLARRMGLLPSSCTFRVATNQNDILHRFFTTGEYRPGEVIPSCAPSMDIQAASNFERFLYFLLGENPERLRVAMDALRTGSALRVEVPQSVLRSSRMDDAHIVETIRRVWCDHGYVVDPHTACGFSDLAADKTSIILATASPAKFPEVVTAATGTEPTHPVLEALKSQPLQRYPLSAEAAALKHFIRAHLP